VRAGTSGQDGVRAGVRVEARLRTGVRVRMGLRAAVMREGYVVNQDMNTNVWQRYYIPIIGLIGKMWESKVDVNWLAGKVSVQFVESGASSFSPLHTFNSHTKLAWIIEPDKYHNCTI